MSTKGAEQSHHVWPMFLGGHKKGDTFDIDAAFHQQFHQLLHRMLRFNGFPGGFGKNASRASYEDLFTRDIKSRKDAHKILLAAAGIFDKACSNKVGGRLRPKIKRQIDQGKWDF